MWRLMGMLLYCRAYYKCSVKDCRAKKMVQPTDKDPSLFQVIYLGVHTCSQTANTRKRKRKARGGAVQAAADKAASLQQVPSREERDHHHHRQSPMKPTTAPPMHSVLQHQTDHQPATTHVGADHQGGQPEITSQLAASAMHDFDEVELAGLETLEDKDFFPLIKLPAPSASSSPVHHHHHHELQVEDRVVADHELLMGDATSDFPPCSWLDFVSDSFGPPEITNSDMAESVQDSVWATGSRGRTARFPTAAVTGQSSSITGSMYWHYIRQLLSIIFKFCNELFDGCERRFHACMGPTTIFFSRSN